MDDCLILSNDLMLDESGNQVFVSSVRNEKPIKQRYSQVAESSKLSTMLSAGVQPEEVNCILHGTSIDSQFDRSHNASVMLGDAILNYGKDSESTPDPTPETTPEPTPETTPTNE